MIIVIIVDTPLMLIQDAIFSLPPLSISFSWHFAELLYAITPPPTFHFHFFHVTFVAISDISSHCCHNIRHYFRCEAAIIYC